LGGALVGVEFRDTATFSCVNGGINYAKCRYSDAAYVLWSDSAHSSGRAVFGELVRPIQRAFGSSGSLVTEVTDYLYFSCHVSSLYNGMTLDKVGSTTGWTYGNVSETSIDVGQAGRASSGGQTVFLFDQVEFGAYADGGDSGSAVFQSDESWFQYSGGIYVCLAGVLWGHGGGSSYFSPRSGISYDNGWFSAY
jgi:hypothetical protein